MDDSEFELMYYDIKELKAYMKLPVSKKLQCLEEMNEFLDAFTPVENKKLQQKLKNMGY
jgi:hypothetical protein